MPRLLPKVPGIELPENPLESIKKGLGEGRELIGNASRDVRSLADSLRGSTKPLTKLQEPTSPQQQPPTGLSTEQTVAYQKREIGKQLLAMEGHYSQKMRIAGVPCDCGATKHLLFLEELCQETIPMVDVPSLYEEILDWIKKVEPKSSESAAQSGNYDNEYPGMSKEARDFRKRVVGTLSPAAMIEPRQNLSLDEAKKLAAEQAEKEVERRWQ